MPSIRHPSQRHSSVRNLDALLGSTWAWDEDDDEHDGHAGPSAGPGASEPEHEHHAAR